MFWTTTLSLLLSFIFIVLAYLDGSSQPNLVLYGIACVFMGTGIGPILYIAYVEKD